MSDRGKAFEHGAVADVWRNTLANIPTCYGRLVYLSSLRDVNTGHYDHDGLYQCFGEGGADRALRQCHTEAFSEWLCFDMEQKKADVDLYLSAFVPRGNRVLETWSRLKPYRSVVPATASAPDIDNFELDFETLLMLLMNASGVSAGE